MPPIPITTHYLEISNPRDLRPKLSPRTDLALVSINPPMPELNRFFYTAVGGDWFWHDRLPWSFQQWLDYLDRPELATWMLTAAGIPAGYFEMEMQADARVEIAYFGLLPSFVGAGLGGHLLTCAIEQGWAMGARSVWLHTCSLDHPNALANYQARGMRLFHTVTHTYEVPAQPCGPWPNARAAQA